MEQIKYLWKECSKCHMEFRLEKGYSDCNLGFKRYICSNCADNAESAFTTFRELTKPPRPPKAK